MKIIQNFSKTEIYKKNKNTQIFKKVCSSGKANIISLYNAGLTSSYYMNTTPAQVEPV